MKFRHWNSKNNIREMTAGEAVKYEIDHSPSCEDGKLEALESRLDRLTTIVGAIVDQMPVKQQKTLVEDLFHWTLDEEEGA